MPIRNIYQTQPDKYVRFTRHGKDMEGEFFKYNWCGDEVSPQAGYIRPFDKFLRQCLVDNLQAGKEMELQDSATKDNLVDCDAFVTHPFIKAPHQSIIEDFDVITKNELVTDKSLIDDCRVDMLQRQYLFAKMRSEPEEILSSILMEYRNRITPNYKPLRYQRTWLQKHGSKVITIAFLLIAFLIIA
ncbi:hypothetical protein [Aeromonas media]|uniref:hypothetical protein n=1 Tax=Aeromonas media TaxID=651 RepID=UPI003D1E399A